MRRGGGDVEYGALFDVASNLCRHSSTFPVTVSLPFVSWSDLKHLLCLQPFVPPLDPPALQSLGMYKSRHSQQAD